MGRILFVVGVLFGVACALFAGEKRGPVGGPPPRRAGPPIRAFGGTPARLPAEIVKKFDKDKDGELSKEEAAEAFKSLKKEFMDNFDGDKDGKLSEEEMKKAAEGCEKIMEERRKELVKKYDTDGDGELSQEERKAAFEKYREELMKHREKMIKKYDKDGDGKLSREEARAAAETMRKKMDEMRAAAEKAFDADGDGELSDKEKEVMRAFGKWLRAKYAPVPLRPRRFMPGPGVRPGPRPVRPEPKKDDDHGEPKQPPRKP